MKNEPLKQTPLPVRMADQLQAEILAGDLTDLLPGCRVLAERYGTSMKTTLAAFEILEQRKLIEPATQGSRRRITKCKSHNKRDLSKASRDALLILYASDLPISVDDWSLLLGYRDCWNRHAGSAAMAQVNYGRYTRPAPILGSLIEKHRANALLLNGAPAAWVEAATAHLPVYCSGGEWQTVETSGDSFGTTRETERVLAELYSLGHRRFLLPVEAHLPAVREVFVAVIRKVLGPDVRGDVVDQMCPVFHESIPDVWMDYWARAFSTTNPTAVVLFKDSHLLSLYGYCSERGIKIPSDVSVVNFGYSEQLEWCRPTPCQMRYPLQKAVSHFRRWINSGLHPIGKTLLSFEKIPGASVAPPRGC